jgi:hypothetical protein
MAFQTWVARFVVDHGRVTEEGGRLRSFYRRRIDEPDVDLHLLGEPRGASGEELGAQAIEAIGRAFAAEKLSLTGGLLRALAATHQTLLDWNRRSVARDQVALGVAAVALQGARAYLAQTGPSLAYFRHGGALKRIVPEEIGLVALGEPGHAGPEVRGFDLEPGDVLIVASPAIESLLDRDTLEGLLERGTEEALPELYLFTRDLPVFALFAVSCLEAQDEEAPAPAADARPPPHVWEVEPPPPPEGHDGPALNLLDPPPIDISRPVVRLRPDVAGGRDYARTTGTRPAFQLSLTRPALLLAAAVVLLVLVAVFAVPDLVRENRQARSATLAEQAQAAYEAALNEPDAAKRRALLMETRRLANEAARVDAQSAAVADLVARASAALSAMDAIFELGPLAPLAVFSRQLTGEVAVERAVVGGGSIFVLDSRGGRVIAVPAAGGPLAVVFESGASYGGVAARQPQFLTWEAAGGRLLVLDAERKLFALRLGEPPANLPLRRTAAWSSVADIAAYDGRLYVLDPAANQVHRYLPSAAGFDSEPTNALAGSPNLAGAVDLAVDRDVFVLTKEGTVRRFRDGIESAFTFAGIDRPLDAPSSLVLAANSGEVFVADSRNKRIVVADREGQFRRQLVSPSFIDLRALAVDAAGAQLFALAGDSLLTGAVPR